MIQILNLIKKGERFAATYEKTSGNPEVISSERGT